MEDAVEIMAEGGKIMPRGDRRGPDGMGPMSGRGLGYCNGYESPGFTKGTSRDGGFRRGFGRGYGRRYGRGFGYQGFSNYPNYPVLQYSAKDEEKYLKMEIENLKNNLKTMEERLSKLKIDEK